jgi:hypothetical protein
MSGIVYIFSNNTWHCVGYILHRHVMGMCRTCGNSLNLRRYHNCIQITLTCFQVPIIEYGSFYRVNLPFRNNAQDLCECSTTLGSHFSKCWCSFIPFKRLQDITYCVTVTGRWKLSTSIAAVVNYYCT